jgi:capsular exopolysaccharide synthesis family protein
VIGAEQFRKLRSRLYQLCEKQPLHTLLITSALPGEGKTFIAVNLAQAVVRQHERRALLIDADLRLSQLHHFLGAPSTPGLSDYLCGEADELSIVQRGPESNLFFIAGGRSVSNPTELIGNGRLNRLLQRLAPVFDWVILDSPPAIPVSDASMLAGMCDGVLLVIQAEATPFDVAQRARDGLRDKRLLGVVLNRVAPHSADAAHYFKYYYTKQENRKHAGYEKS